MYNSVVTAYKQNKKKKKVKVHLQKETNYHTMPRFCENVFDHLSLDILYVLYPVCTIHLLPPVGVLAQLS